MGKIEKFLKTSKKYKNYGGKNERI